MIKTGIFVDVQNIYYTTKEQFSKPFNYRQLWQDLSFNHEIVCANAYAIARQDDQQHKFQKALKHIGFNVKLKPFIQRSDGSAKGDWDVGITIDMIEAAPGLEHVILLSGDGDFELLIRHLKQKHALTTQVIGVEALTANNLISCADIFTPIKPNMLIN